MNRTSKLHGAVERGELCGRKSRAAGRRARGGAGAGRLEEERPAGKWGGGGRQRHTFASVVNRDRRRPE